MKNLLFSLINRHLSKTSVVFLSLVLCLLSFVLCPLSSSAQIPTYVPTSGLVGWWPFNGNANDESGNGNNGTVNGATLTTDRFGVANRAYSFDGVNDYVSCNPIIGIQEISVSIWLKKNGLGGHLVSQNIWNNVQSVSFGSAYEKSTNNFSVGVNSGNCNFQGSQSFTGIFYNLDANWHHRVITINNLGLISDYLDGQLINSATISNFQWCNSANAILKFGAWWISDIQSWDGKLDDISIYNRNLTQQEITNLYTSSVPPTITTTASSSLINCGESSTLTASSTSAVQPCMKADLPATLQNGLVGYWPFCGNANDASGNGNNGTVNGATLTTDRFGNAGSAYSFDGVSNYVNVLDANSLDFSNNYTLSGWYLTNNVNQTDQAIIGKGRATSGTGYQLLVNTSPLNLMQFGYNDNVVNGGATTPATSSNLNGWHFFTGTYDGSVAKIFMDGVLLNSVSTVYSLQNSTIPLNIGRETSGLGRYFNGKLDDIVIYNRALTPTEIQQLYNLGNVTYSWSTGATTPSITVTPAQTTSYTCTATNASGSTTSSVSVTVADTLTWTGLYDTDWHKPCNWSPQFVPKCCNNVSVPLTANQPIVSGVAAVEDLSIFTTNGAQVTVNTGANLQIADCPTTITTTACPSLAVISTTAVSSITQTTAISGGSISYQGASAITARGVCWSTSPNPTIANSITSNGTGIGTFTSNLSGLVAGTTYYLRAYATNGSGTSYGNEVSFFVIPPQPAYPLGTVFCGSGTTIVVDITNPSTGKTWMDRNLGASRVALSVSDSSSFGDLYQWGRGSDGHQCRNSAVISTLSSSNQPGHGNYIVAPANPYDWRSPQFTGLWQGLSGVNNPCPTGYRIPTSVELSAEFATWSGPTINGAFGAVLKFPAAGGRSFSNGLIEGPGTDFYYWSSTVSSTRSNALSRWGTNNIAITANGRVIGSSIRCIKN